MEYKEAQLLVLLFCFPPVDPQRQCFQPESTNANLIF